MNRRKLFKTGLALAGGSVLTSVIHAQDIKQEDDRRNSQTTSTDTGHGRRKLGTLEVSSRLFV